MSIEDRSIVLASLNLARNLNVSSVAEGVESLEQETFMIENGCTTRQGYLYGKPVQANEAEKLLIETHSLPS